MGNSASRIQGRSTDRCPAALTPGILGRFDAADPNVRMSHAGNTCGPLGLGDDLACYLSKGNEATHTSAPVAKVTKLDGMRAIDSILKAIDGDKDLSGAGVILEMAGAEPLRIRESDHPSGKPTDVIVKMSFATANKDNSWWTKWSGAVLNCGGTALGVVGTAVSCTAAPVTGGLSAPACYLSVVGTVGSATQCSLAVAKATNEEFAEYVQTEDGKWIDNVDIGLDLMSLGLGVGMLKSAVKSGSSALKASKYASLLGKTDKGKLLKTLEKLEKLQAEYGDLRKLLERGVVLKNPAKKAQLTNNIIRRMLPLTTKQINRELVESLSTVIGTVLSIQSSHSEGVIGKLEGLKIEIEVQQYVPDE